MTIVETPTNILSLCRSDSDTICTQLDQPLNHAAEAIHLQDVHSLGCVPLQLKDETIVLNTHTSE